MVFKTDNCDNSCIQGIRMFQNGWISRKVCIFKKKRQNV